MTRGLNYFCLLLAQKRQNLHPNVQVGVNKQTILARSQMCAQGRKLKGWYHLTVCHSNTQWRNLGKPLKTKLSQKEYDYSVCKGSQESNYVKSKGRDTPYLMSCFPIALPQTISFQDIKERTRVSRRGKEYHTPSQTPRHQHHMFTLVVIKGLYCYQIVV